MRAVTYRRYGGPEVLEIARIERPTPRPDQVRVRVRAASINAADYRLMRADPFLARLGNGLLRPRRWPVLGSDLAGVVEEVGAAVEGLCVGDEVFGDAFADGRGTFAEQVCVSARALALKPPTASFEEAATLPLAGLTALQGLSGPGQVQPGQQLLVYGAGGGVGPFVVQIAHALGAHVTAVCSARSAPMIQASGADRVLDYAREDFAAEGQLYDAILAVNGHRPLADYKRCLKPGGRYVMIGGDSRQLFEGLLLARLAFIASGRRAFTLTLDDSRTAADLATLRDLLERGALRPFIDRTFPLEQAQEAMRYVEQDHPRGKVVLTLPG